MWTCKRLGVPAILAILVAAAAHCGADPGECFRYSDCAQGLTCAFGRCVVPPPPGGDDGGGVQSNVDGGLATGDSGPLSAEASGADGPAFGDDAGSLLGDAPAE